MSIKSLLKRRFNLVKAVNSDDTSRMNLYIEKRLKIVEENTWKVSRTSLLRNALKRLRRGFPKMDFIKGKHEDCANFDKGTCRFFHFTNVDPKGQACPHFKAKRKAEVETADTGHV